MVWSVAVAPSIVTVPGLRTVQENMVLEWQVIRPDLVRLTLAPLGLLQGTILVATGWMSC